MSAASTNAIEVRVPTILRPYTGGSKTVIGHGATLRELIADLGKQFSGLDDRLMENGALLRFINVYLTMKDVRFIGGLDLCA